MNRLKKVITVMILSVLLIPNVVNAEVSRNSFKETIDDEISIFGGQEGYESYIDVLKQTDLSNYKENSKKANVYIFRGNTCGYCLKAVAFFASIAEEYGDKFNLYTYEVWNNEDNSALLEKAAAKLNETVSGVPVIIIGKKVFSGYTNSYDADIKTAIETEYKNGNANDVMKQIDSGSTNTSNTVIIGLCVIVAGLGALLAFMKYSAKSNKSN